MPGPDGRHLEIEPYLLHYSSGSLNNGDRKSGRSTLKKKLHSSHKSSTHNRPTSTRLKKTPILSKPLVQPRNINTANIPQGFNGDITLGAADYKKFMDYKKYDPSLLSKVDLDNFILRPDGIYAYNVKDEKAYDLMQKQLLEAESKYKKEKAANAKLQLELASFKPQGIETEDMPGLPFEMGKKEEPVTIDVPDWFLNHVKKVNDFLDGGDSEPLYITNPIAEKAMGAFMNVAQSADKIAQGYINGITPAFNSFSLAVDDYNDPTKSASDVGLDIYDGVINGITGVVSTPVNAVLNAADQVVNLPENIYNGINGNYGASDNQIVSKPVGTVFSTLNIPEWIQMGYNAMDQLDDNGWSAAGNTLLTLNPWYISATGKPADTWLANSDLGKRLQNTYWAGMSLLGAKKGKSKLVEDKVETPIVDPIKPEVTTGVHVPTAEELQARTFFPVSEYGDAPIYSKETMPEIKLRVNRDRLESGFFPNEDIISLEYNVGETVDALGNPIELPTEDIVKRANREFQEADHGTTLSFDENGALSTDSAPWLMALMQKWHRHGLGYPYYPERVPNSNCFVPGKTALNFHGKKPINAETTIFLNKQLNKLNAYLRDNNIPILYPKYEMRMHPIRNYPMIYGPRLGFFKFNKGGKLY